MDSHSLASAGTMSSRPSSPFTLNLVDPCVFFKGSCSPFTWMTSFPSPRTRFSQVNSCGRWSLALERLNTRALLEGCHRKICVDQPSYVEELVISLRSSNKPTLMGTSSRGRIPSPSNRKYVYTSEAEHFTELILVF
jgi:hypothetical protein